MVTNVGVKFNYDRLYIDKALGNFQQYDNNKNKNTVGRASCVHIPSPKK